MRVAIMQPTYLPWSGYFGLMMSVDLFVFLDTVQFARRSWQQRNQIKTANGPQWLSVPVLSKGKRDQAISEVEIDASARFANVHCRSIELNYKKAPHFAGYFNALSEVLERDTAKLADLNIDLITLLGEQLGVSTPTVRASELSNAGAKADLLAHLCQQLDATEYVSPPGSRDYLDQSDAFEKIGIKVSYFSFEHPVHDQLFGAFVPYMSVVDMLLNCGSHSEALIAEGCGGTQ